jgi:predicted aspartyl protease
VLYKGFYDLDAMKFILKTLGIPVLFLIVASCSTGQGLFGRGSILDKEGTSDLVKVPVRVSRNVFFVDVEIEGETYNFLFDSGAPMVISPEIMEKHGAIVLREANVTDSQGAKVKQEFVKMPNFAIGDREFSGLTAVVSDLKRSPIIRCLAIDGILGANAMQFQYWDFSHKDSILQMSNSKRHWQLDTAKTYRLPWSFKATRTPKVQLTINGKVIEDITFDTGSGGVLGLHESIIGPLDLENAEFMAQGHLSGGLFGSAVDTAYTFSLPIHFPDTSYMFQVEQVQALSCVFGLSRSSGLFSTSGRISIDKKMALKSLFSGWSNNYWPSK